MTQNADLGHAIRLARQRKRLTQAELAEKVGVHEKTIGKWENGVQVPKRRLHLLTDVLDLQPTGQQQPKPARPAELAQMRWGELLNLQMAIIAELARRFPQDTNQTRPPQRINRTETALASNEPDYRCPGCNQVSTFILNPEQAFCTNEQGCKVLSFNPSLPDGGLSQANVVDLPDLGQ